MNADVRALCGVSAATANRILAGLAEESKLVKCHENGHWAYSLKYRRIVMNIKPYDKTIRDLLGSKRQFLIPRFQREYSWDKKNYQEFLKI